MRPFAHGTTAGLLFVLAGCQGPAATVQPAAPQLFDGMGGHSRKVTTGSPLAQSYFDQGLVWAYAFNHDEAIRSFGEAGRIDPNCAMAWWGIALCNGPHINNPLVTPEQWKTGRDALEKALARREAAMPAERALIDAVAKRYAPTQPADRRPLDEAYAAAMEAVWKANSGDADAGTLYAEALMDLQPWDLWAKDGSPKSRTTEIVAVLERVLRIDPDHPGANHLYIHAVEASPHPEKGIASADRLRTAVPMAGHLVHMPSHIDVQVGRWSQAADQNERAIEADRRYRAIAPKQGFYNVYMAHNHHFLSFACMMEGRSGNAIQAARDMVAGVPADYIRDQAAFVDPYMMIVSETLMRFGRWDDVLRQPAPAKNLPISTALWHFTRGVAHAAKGEVDRALDEQTKFRAAVQKVPPDALMAINPARKVLSIADHVLAGEIAYRQDRIDDAVRELRAAVALEDDLLYMEPPDWIQPVRHTLGAVLVDAGRYDEAEQVYREDFKIWPENGWSLYGLSVCLKAQGKPEDARQADARFRKAWSRADVKIGSSCLCVASRD